ncbi:FHA domain-containing protein [Moorena sp. SIO3H5]|uniref:FHA domain-containing protein n=1 Tax=Moorena sp. SIO3H5 TaxID=2607834 RepID=UPI0013B70DB0|nr:FHA domain-containing protein [Moorena sp. SIO3H5]NEO72348.1 FHA domain-containing protein [Moorena sp. SIO3H5]
MDKHIEFQEQWEVLSTKIRSLRKAIATEPNPTHKLNYQRELEEAERERSELEQKIDFIQEDRIILNLKGSNNEVHCVFKDWAIIGRSPNCGFWIDDDSHQISNLHAAIYYKLETNDYWIEDLKSINGTYVDDQKINHKTKLFLGARVQLCSSFSFLFEHNQNDPLSPGVLIQHDSDGEEVRRYIIVPKGKVLVGTNTNEVVRFSKFIESKTLGSLIRQSDGFYFINLNNEELLLKHNSELTLDFFKIGITILNIVPKTTLGKTYAIDDDLESKLEPEEKEIKRPPEGAVPPYLWKLNIFFGIVALSVTAIFHFTLFNPSPNKVLNQWVNQCLLDFQNKNNRHWREKSQVSPSSVKVILTRQPSDSEQVLWGFIENSGLSKKVDTTIYFDYWEFDERGDFKKQHSNSFWIAIENYNLLGLLQLKITYWSPDLKSLVFEWERKYFLYLPLTFILVLMVYISRFIQDQIIIEYRNTLQKEYDDFQAKRTKKIFDAKLSLDEARQLAQRGELAKALTITNGLLRSMSKSMPVYKAIVELRKIVLTQINSGGGSITVESLPGMSSNFPKSTDVSRLLYLRILGTPYAYQAPYGLKTITIGRQRRKQGLSATEGNDVIISWGGDKRPVTLDIS